MSFIFVSHASDDKPMRIRPLVEVLIAEGETAWIDRPGAGAGNLGFSQDYISRHDIDFLQSGTPWSTSIEDALRGSGAVLGCLSRRTVAALVLAPQAAWAFGQAGTSHIAQDFVEKLKPGI